MKNFYRLLPFLAIGMILCFASVSNAQKKCRNKKNKIVPCPTTKTSQETANNPAVPTTPQSDGLKWQTLKVEECGFTIDFPAKPEKTVAGNGPMWIVNLSDAQYWVSCSPLERASCLDPQGYLQGAALAFPYEIKHKEYINVTDFPGTIAVVLFGISNNGQVAANQVVYAIPNKCRSVATTALLTKNGNSASVRRFISSLKLF
jgi:hypothetical protein